MAGQLGAGADRSASPRGGSAPKSLYGPKGESLNDQASRPSIRWSSVCVDCSDAEATAEFYGQLLGWEITDRDEPATPGGGSPWIALRDPQGGVGLLFQAEPWYEPPVWPEQSGRQTKMLHLEIHVDDVDAAVERAVALGATVAPHQPPDRDPKELRVLLDPAGHPFCLWK